MVYVYKAVETKPPGAYMGLNGLTALYLSMVKGAALGSRYLARSN